jgi:hypothetical protein
MMFGHKQEWEKKLWRRGYEAGLRGVVPTVTVTGPGIPPGTYATGKGAEFCIVIDQEHATEWFRSALVENNWPIIWVVKIVQ